MVLEGGAAGIVHADETASRAVKKAPRNWFIWIDAMSDQRRWFELHRLLELEQTAVPVIYLRSSFPVQPAVATQTHCPWFNPPVDG